MRNGVIGSTADSDSVSRGSSPFSVALKNLFRQVLFYFSNKLKSKKRSAGCTLNRSGNLSQATDSGAGICQGIFHFIGEFIGLQIRKEVLV